MAVASRFVARLCGSMMDEREKKFLSSVMIWAVVVPEFGV
jgi:hypothetical protein